MKAFPSGYQGRKAHIVRGDVRIITDDACGFVDLWVCPLPSRAIQPFAVTTCAECGTAIAFRASARALTCVGPSTRKVCQACAVTLSHKAR